MRETLRRTGKVGIASVVIRTRQRVGAVVPRGPALALELMRYAHELREPEEVAALAGGLSKAGVTRKEVEMAEQIVEAMARDWKPSRYKDEYHDDLMVVDLLPLLQRSVQQSHSRRGRRRPARAARPARRRRSRSA